MAVEGARRCELAKLVPDHVLRDEHGDELAPVVHCEGHAHGLRENRRAPGPGLDRLARARRDGVFDLLEQVAVDERTLLDTPCHLYLTLRWVTIMVSVRLLLRVFLPLAS